MSSKRIEVELPVCPECLLAGKIPDAYNKGKWYCTGPPGQLHARKKMTKRVFREIR